MSVFDRESVDLWFNLAGLTGFCKVFLEDILIVQGTELICVKR